MPAAILIGAGIAGIASIYAANKGANASKSAAATQSASADKALALSRDIYQDQRRLVDPYVQAGTQSLNSMMSRYGNAGGPMPNYQPPPSQYGFQMGGFSNGAWNPNIQQGPKPVGGGMSLGAMNGGGPMNTAGQQMVTLRAPSGEVMPVPVAHAQHYIRLGAQPVGNQ